MQTILVVEDDHDLNQSIGYSLKKSGYAVCGVTSIEKAKQMFNRNQIDLILLDVNLPDGEGFSFCRWVKAKKRSSSYVFNGQRYGGRCFGRI